MYRPPVNKPFPPTSSLRIVRMYRPRVVRSFDLPVRWHKQHKSMPLSEAVDAARMRKERSDHRRGEQDAFFVDAARKRKERSDHKRAVQDAEIPAADDSLPTRGRQRSSTPQSMVKAPGVASRSVKEDVAAHKRVTRSDHKRAVQDAEFASLEGPRRRSCLTRRFTANINTSSNGCDTWSRSR